MNDPVLVLGLVWAGYLGVRLAAEAVRVFVLPRVMAADRAQRAAAPSPDADHSRAGKKRWTPLPAILWLVVEAAVAALVISAVWLVLAALNVDVPASVAQAHGDTRRQTAMAVILGWSLLVINVPLAWRLVGHLLPADSKKAEGGVDPGRMGATIGVLERLLVVALVPGGGSAAVGFVVAAKTLARFKELNKKRFAERYLLGTMASVTVALVSALVAQWIWTNQV